MKLTRLCILAGLAVAGAHTMQAQVGFSNPKPNPEAVLDLNPATGVATKGFLLPRVELEDLTSPAPLREHARGMMVWNTSDAPGRPAPGLYWNTGTGWATASTGGKAWSLEGNAGTDTTVNFIGTTDAQPLVFRVNNTPVMKLLENGNIAMESSEVDGTYSLVLGPQSTLISAPADPINGGAIIGGLSNSITHDVTLEKPNLALIAGGFGNAISGGYSSAIVGGSNHIATGSWSGIFAGREHRATALFAVVLGGESNTVLGGARNAAVVGGFSNKVVGAGVVIGAADNSFIGGGAGNNIGAVSAAIMGGQNNTSAMHASAVIAGLENQILGDDQYMHPASVIAGGSRNRIGNSAYSAVLGGEADWVLDSELSAVVSGQNNRIIASQRSAILAGTSSTVQRSPMSAIIAGNSNVLEDDANSVILAGTLNAIRGIPYGSILGGTGNVIEAAPPGSDERTPGHCLITGGTENAIRGAERSTIVSGGMYNLIEYAPSDGVGAGSPGNSVIIGGDGNEIRARDAVAMGNWNQINGDRSIVIGGYACQNDGVHSGIYGGLNTGISGGRNSAIMQSEESSLTGNNSVIIGGFGHRLTGDNSVILGGIGMSLNGNNQLGFGGGTYLENNIVGLSNVDVLLNNYAVGGVARTSVLRFYSLDRAGGSMGAYYTGFRAPNTLPGQANIVYTLPNAQGAAGSVMSNDGSGTLSWVTAKSVVNNGIVRGRVAIGNGVAQNIVINDVNVTANGVIVVTYEDPAAAGNPANIPTHAVTARAAGANFQVSFSQAPPAGANLNYMIFP